MMERVNDGHIGVSKSREWSYLWQAQIRQDVEAVVHRPKKDGIDDCDGAGDPVRRDREFNDPIDDATSRRTRQSVNGGSEEGISRVCPSEPSLAVAEVEHEGRSDQNVCRGGGGSGAGGQASVRSLRSKASDT